MGVYKESDDHKPEPTALSGTFDTSDAGGSGHYTRVENLAPIFEVAKAHALHVAARALDPDDEEVSESLVQRSTAFTVSQGDPEGDKQRLLDRANRDGANASDRMTYRRTEEAMAQWRHEVAAMRGAEEGPEAAQAALETPVGPEVTGHTTEAQNDARGESEPAQEPQEPESSDEEPQGGEAETPEERAKAKRPSVTDPKAMWVTYAHSVAQDSDEDAAIDEMTKADLVATYGRHESEG